MLMIVVLRSAPLALNMIGIIVKSIAGQHVAHMATNQQCARCKVWEKKGFLGTGYILLLTVRAEGVALSFGLPFSVDGRAPGAHGSIVGCKAARAYPDGG